MRPTVARRAHPSSQASAVDPILEKSGSTTSGTITAASRFPAHAKEVAEARTAMGRISAPYIVMIGVYTATPAENAITEVMRSHDSVDSKNVTSASDWNTQHATIDKRREVLSTRKPVANVLTAGPKVATATYNNVSFKL